MSYDFSFEKSQMWLLGALAALMSVLLVAAGFLIGRITVTPSATTASVAMPVVPLAATASSGSATIKAQPAPVPAPVLTIPSASTPVVAAAPSSEVTQLTPPTQDASGTVDISSASSSGSATAGNEVYQLAASGYALQYGAFRDPANARDLMKQLKEQKIIASLMTMQNAYGETYSVVRSGAYPTVADARQAAVEQANKLQMPIVVRPAGRL